jgi:hypothetical protein
VAGPRTEWSVSGPNASRGSKRTEVGGALADRIAPTGGPTDRRVQLPGAAGSLPVIVLGGGRP